MSGPNHRMLVVDDDPLVRRALARLFAPMGYEVATAESGREAISLFSRGSYPVVITDIGLPGLDGLSLVEELLEIEPSTSFVVVTSKEAVGSERRPGEKAIVSVISKPWDEEELFAAVREAADIQAHRAAGTADLEHDCILSVEDNDDDAILLEELLECGPAGVTRAVRLSDAVELLCARAYPIVITDLSLPDARGLDCVSSLVRASPSSTIVVHSGLDDNALASQAIRRGAGDYLVKGRVTGPELRRAIRFAVERKATEQRISALAHTDDLTGLCNRPAFFDRVRRALARSRRTRKPISLLYLDLDRFKEVNDSLGHAAGDAVLQGFARRLVDAVRCYDTVGRLGGDEFAILLEDLDRYDDVKQVASRIVAAMGEPLVIDGQPLCLGTSIGVGNYPTSGDSVEALISSADAAMYEAKRLGTNRVCFSEGA